MKNRCILSLELISFTCEIMALHFVSCSLKLYIFFSSLLCQYFVCLPFGINVCTIQVMERGVGDVENCKRHVALCKMCFDFV